ncbi:MAG: hypothetical protein LUE17_14650 [Planctomycetaceae bacterium]|nr:hypothetical protein [Planctomycetaceae bacterium]
MAVAAGGVVVEACGGGEVDGEDAVVFPHRVEHLEDGVDAVRRFARRYPVAEERVVDEEHDAARRLLDGGVHLGQHLVGDERELDALQLLPHVALIEVAVQENYRRGGNDEQDDDEEHDLFDNTHAAHVIPSLGSAQPV